MAKRRLSNGAAANAAYNFAYQQAVAEGVSIFVSAGDEGAASADNGNVATHGIGVSGFTSTPYNVSVGGTDFGYTRRQRSREYLLERDQCAELSVRRSLTFRKFRGTIRAPAD